MTGFFDRSLKYLRGNQKRQFAGEGVLVLKNAKGSVGPMCFGKKETVYIQGKFIRCLLHVDLLYKR